VGFRFLSVLNFVGVAAITPSAQSTNPLAGTWELNVAKSKFSSANQATRSQTREYQISGHQEKGIQKGIGPDGKPTLVEFTANYDGKDYSYKW
jgi:hypothetical protein